MESTLALYRTKVAELETCSDTWFGNALAAAREGDDGARRRIVGSCLRVAMAVAQRHCPELSDDELLSQIEDANYRLWRSVETFSGKTAAEFVYHAEQVIDAHFA